MADPRYFRVAGPFTVSELARQTGAEIAGAANTELTLDDVQPLETAQPHHLSFLSNLRYVETFRQSNAGAVLIMAAAKDKAPVGMTLLVVADPYLAFAQAARLFYPPAERRTDIAATAVIEADVTLGDCVSIGHYAVIGSGSHIGSGTRIGAHGVIGNNVVIGADCHLHANVTLSNCIMGDRVTVYPGARIGQDGFGFATDRNGTHLSIPQLGRVLIGDDVRIGANSTIDRGAGPDTVIGPGCMIDNLVQIGHNVVLGRGCVLAAQAGISGSTKLGDFVMVGGQVGLAGHITIGSAARIAGKSGVMQDVPPQATVGGIPAVPMMQWLRHNAILEKLARKRDK